MELTLQWYQKAYKVININGRNPYFIGINSAIIISEPICCKPLNVAILILLELTLQWIIRLNGAHLHTCRNPYFIEINSAISINVGRGIGR